MALREPVDNSLVLHLESLGSWLLSHHHHHYYCYYYYYYRFWIRIIYYKRRGGNKCGNYFDIYIFFQIRILVSISFRFLFLSWSPKLQRNNKAMRCQHTKKRKKKKKNINNSHILFLFFFPPRYFLLLTSLVAAAVPLFVRTGFLEDRRCSGIQSLS